MSLSDQHRAVHETGHVLVAHAFGWRVEQVSIDGGAAGEGLTLVDVPDEDRLLLEAQTEAGSARAKERYEQRLIQLAAGAAAEELAYRRHDGAGAPDIVQSDWGEVVSLIERWTFARPVLSSLVFGYSAPFSAATESAQVIIQSERYSPVLGPLINHLVAQRCLSEEELYAFLTQHGLPSPAPEGLP